MIEINKNRLVPAITASWGDITGDISKQEDLMSVLSGYATESWVSSKNYLTASSLKTINYQSIVGEGNIEIEASIPDTYATKAWVSAQGYLTSETLPSDIATQSWVVSQGYLTSVPDSFATKSWVSDQGYITTSALSGYATEAWVSSQDYLSESDPIIAPLLEQDTVLEGNSGSFKDTKTGTYAPQERVFAIQDKFYLLTGDKIYLFNTETVSFDMFMQLEPDMGSQRFLWEDAYGNMHLGVDYTIYNPGPGSYYYEYWDSGAPFPEVYGGRYNIINYDGWTYMLSDGDGLAYVLDPTSLTFNAINPIPFSNSYSEWYKRVLNFDGHIVYTRSGSMYSFEVTMEGGVPVSCGFSVLSEPLYPLIDNSIPTTSYVVYADGCYHYIKSDGVYKLKGVPGSYTEWELMEDFTMPLSSWTVDLQGASMLKTYSDLSDNKFVLGYGYRNGYLYLLIWYFGEDKTEYKFINELEGEIEVLNDKISNYPDSSEIATQSWVSGQGYVDYGGLNSTLTDYALKSDVILNNIELPYGANYTPLGQAGWNPDYRYYWTTPSGRLFYSNIDDGTYVFNPTTGEWIQVNTGIPTVGSEYIYKTATNMFYIDPNIGTFIWDETNTTWTLITSKPSSGFSTFTDVWVTNDDTIRTSTKKLVNNGGSWSWTNSATQEFQPGKSLLVGNLVYVFVDTQNEGSYNNVYLYDESTTTYTFVGYLDLEVGYNFAVLGDDVFYPGTENVVYRYNVGLGVSPQPTDVPNFGVSNLYIAYGGHLCAMSDSEFISTYDYIESKPEVPSVNGTYVLKATYNNGTVTYSWIADEVPQAVQITNEILS